MNRKISDGPIWKPTGALAANYDDLCLHMPSFERAQRALANAVISYCSRSDDKMTVLDVGCGTGITSGFLLTALEDIHVTAVDSDDTMLSAAKQRLELYEPRVHIENTDIITYLAGAHPPWNVIVCAFTLHNLGKDHQANVLKHIYKAIRPGGMFVLADYAIREGDDKIVAFGKHIEELFDVLVRRDKFVALKEWTVHTLEDMRDTRVQAEATLKEMLKQAGFADIRTSFHGPLETVFECPVAEAISN